MRRRLGLLLVTLVLVAVGVWLVATYGEEWRPAVHALLRRVSSGIL
ncbi:MULTISPECIES: hypothetical protein [Cellulomonas]|uniref:Uncharacterized protein n=1 Tax=Cellulomonas iranensis TaxID=76862 RepID=A0ABU0GJB8_9CELL|nr:MULTISPECIES: hypothetical protein [Cellulomonas]MDQ0425168.1 hypothetical protein [Cellulomonas iranensis]